MSLDWSRCIICQSITNEELKCPLNSLVPQAEERHKAYRSFLQNATAFRELNALPVNLSLDESIDVDALCSNRASWHKSCHLKFSLSKLGKVRERANKRYSSSIETGDKDATVTRAKRQAVINTAETCIFCNRSEENGKLHSFTSMNANTEIRRMAAKLEDFDLLGRISGGDLIAIEAKYHLNPCLTSFRNRYRSVSSKKAEASTESNNDLMNETRAFLELVEHLEECVRNNKFMFKLAELHSLYVCRLQDLGTHKEVNKTRLKNCIIDHFGDYIQEQNDGRNTVLIFREGMSNLLKDAFKQQHVSDNVTTLAKAAAIIRKDMFLHKQFKFSGCFPLDCQADSIPPSLKLIVSMILNGADIQNQEKHESQPCMTICQTIIFNTKKRVCDTKTGQSRHSANREPPLPIYLGFNIHSLTRSKTLINKLYQLGLSISYDRVMEIEEWLATSVSERFREDGCVAPACLRKNIFTVAALDNLDHNPSSTTSVSSFHGTGISIFQFPKENKAGDCRPPITIPPSRAEKHSLPEGYSVVPPVALVSSSVLVPACTMSPVPSTLNDAKAREDQWVSHASSQLEKDTVVAEDTVAWAAYHSSLQESTSNPPAITALLPLFYEKAASPAMIKHGMNVIRQATSFLNPQQIPVIALDQPLFALAKMVQWKWPATYGENNFVVMFGGLHLEMGLWNTLGDLLEGSGWTAAITEADVASSGVAQAFLKASHITRTRYM